MELPFDMWNRIFEQCDSFKEKRKLYDSLPDTFHHLYPKFIVPDGDKCLLNYLAIDDDKEVILSLKIGGYLSSDSQPISVFKEEKDKEPKMICSVCYDGAITLLLEPCNHICICEKCYDSLIEKDCPICKTKISATKKVFFASPSQNKI